MSSCCESCGTERSTAARRNNPIMDVTYTTTGYRWYQPVQVFICDGCFAELDSEAIEILQRDERERWVDA